MASGIEEWVEGFVYRGRPPGSTQATDWSVEIGRFVEVEGFGRTMLPNLILTPAQAKAAGHDLPDVLAALNREVLAERDALRAERDALAAGPDTPAAAVAGVISDRQFFQALALAGDITQAEALAAVMTGTLPAMIETAVEALPDADRFTARMLISGATTFDRAHPMVALLGAILGKDDAALDAIWASARQL